MNIFKLSLDNSIKIAFNLMILTWYFSICLVPASLLCPEFSWISQEIFLFMLLYTRRNVCANYHIIYLADYILLFVLLLYPYFPRHCLSSTFYLLLYTCIQDISLLCFLELMQKLLSWWFPVEPNSFAVELDCDNCNL